MDPAKVTRDWETREASEEVRTAVVSMAAFLNKFGKMCLCVT